jgi:hypothetical protein
MRKYVEDSAGARALRALVQLCIAALGLLAIVGSGGGAGSLGFPDTSCLNTPQGCGGTPPPAQPTATMTVDHLVVQVGSAVNFAVSTDAKSPTYRWCRQPKGAATCADIVGVSGPTYTLASANLADDGASIQVNVHGSNGDALAGAILAVSSMPPLAFGDTEFADSDWNLVALVTPPLPGLKFSASQSSSDGNPGAFRRLSLDLPLEVRTVNLISTRASTPYEPGTQGAVYVIEFSLDCNNIAVTLASSFSNYWLPTLEQGGRRFLPDRNAAATCFSPGWNTRGWLGFGAAAFKQVDGPACGTGEACPDFSSQGAPIRLGLAYTVELRSPLPAAGASAPHFEQGLDNWRATVWRR